MNARRPKVRSDFRGMRAVLLATLVCFCTPGEVSRQSAHASALPPWLRFTFGGTLPVASGYPALPPPNELLPLFPLFIDLLVDYVALDDATKIPFSYWVMANGISDPPTIAGLTQLYIWHKHVLEYWNRWGWPG